ncbi:MAG TPA: extracellular matrix/biofilm biosynthesis regulator RemA family protein [Desulfosporosinus sp.]|nr:extracellular matrix/biofilm biosynthesis regulator RemA family protein [Desulfosporosinus sp.]
MHLGGDVLIKKNKIVAIVDLETIKESKVNDNFFKSAINNNKNIHVSENGKDKTLIITLKEQYLSPISATTLAKRGGLV